MNQQFRTHAGTSGDVGRAIVEWLNPKQGELTAESAFSGQNLSALVTWICIRTNIPIVQPLPNKMTIAQIVEMFQKAAGV